MTEDIEVKCQINAVVANLDARQEKFLAGVIAVLTDPAQKADLAAMESGAGSIIMRRDGRAQVVCEMSGAHGVTRPTNARN